MQHTIHNRTWLERFNIRMNQSNEVLLFTVSIDPDDEISINTITDFEKDLLAAILRQLADSLDSMKDNKIVLQNKGLLGN